jgi:hypothetical protein
MGIGSDTGWITWQPTELQAPATNTVVVRVTDDGAPALSDSRHLVVVVHAIRRDLVLTGHTAANGQFQLTLTGGVFGDVLEVQASSNLQDWTTIAEPHMLRGGVTVTDSAAANLRLRFYRALVKTPGD